MTKKKGTNGNKRSCLVCKRIFENNFKIKEHYDKSKCGKIRNHPRFGPWKSSASKGKAIQYWLKNGTLPEWRGTKPPEPVMEALPVVERVGRKPRYRLRHQRAEKPQLNFCPHCGADLQGVAR